MERLKEIEEAIEVCEKMRGSSSNLAKAAPVQVHIYNVFTSAKRELSGLKAEIEDVLGIYNLKDK